MTVRIESVCPLLQVFDMTASLEFYVRVLGFDVIDHAPESEPWDWAWLSHGGTEIMLNTLYEAEHRPPAPDPERAVAHGDTVIFFGCPDVDAACAHLRDCGVEVDPPVVAPYGMKQLNVKDPDGYALCFQWRVA